MNKLSEPTTIKVTHANLNTPVEVSVGLIYARYYSAGHKSTMLLSSGGALVPVSETLEQIAALIAGANDGAGTTTTKEK